METDYWNKITVPQRIGVEKQPNNKVVVSTLCICDHNGKQTPIYIKWKNNRIYKIDEIINMKPIGAPRVGGREIQYTIRINKKQTNLFYDNKFWYVYEKIS